ncbi:MAG: bifunctional ADP-heptose synthase [Candidatus Andersenbacteria bacterium]|nr:bifunctional ADP-heptose synthase [bacterium]MDZ4225583.1 bifunctional ADP-heptose synthase [Candidatus Andersenbacteria bacterium]
MELSRAKELINQFAGKCVLVVGDVFLDRYIYGKVERLNPEAPVPILLAQEEKKATGGAGNTAKNLAMLGAQTILIGVSGEDDVADEVAETAGKEGYDLKPVRDKERSTIDKTRFIVKTQQILRVDYEEASDVSGEVEEKLIAAIREAAKEADGVLVSDYAKGVVTEKVAEAVQVVCKENNLPLMADVKPSRINYFTNATYLSPNRKEAHEFLGLNQFDGGGKDKEELAALLHETFGATIFLTLSDQGIYVFDGGGEGEHIPQDYVKSNDVLDPSGCGDTVAAVVLLAKLGGAEDAEAADLANAAAAVVAHKIGSAGTTGAEVIDLLTHYNER